MAVSQTSLGIELSDEKFTKPQGHTPASANVNELLENAFDHPLDFPRLRESVFPGDKVVVVLHPDLPQPQSIVRGFAKYFDTTEIDPVDVSYLSAVELKNDASDSYPGVLVHDPDDEHSIAYIAANLEGQPVLVNRALFDADVILPVCIASPVVAGVEDCLYPGFSSTETLTRFRDEKNSASSRAIEIETANNGLGIFLSLHIVSSPGGEISEAHFGRKDLAEKTATENSDAAWTVNPVFGCQRYCGDD